MHARSPRPLPRRHRPSQRPAGAQSRESNIVSRWSARISRRVGDQLPRLRSPWRERTDRGPFTFDCRCRAGSSPVRLDHRVPAVLRHPIVQSMMPRASRATAIGQWCTTRDRYTEKVANPPRRAARRAPFAHTVVRQAVQFQGGPLHRTGHQRSSRTYPNAAGDHGRNAHPEWNNPERFRFSRADATRSESRDHELDYREPVQMWTPAGPSSNTVVQIMGRAVKSSSGSSFIPCSACCHSTFFRASSSAVPLSHSPTMT